MKKLFLLFIAFTIIFSCEKSNTVEDAEFNQLQIDNVLELTGKRQKNAYVLLSSELKYQIWTDKFAKSKTYLNDDQVKVVNDLLNIISPDLFEVQDLSNSKYTSQIDSWLTKAQKVFDKKEFILTFVSLDHTTEEYLRSIGDPLPLDDESCRCSSSQDMCWWWDDCTGDDCSDTYTGCGILWGSPCNGTCE